MSTAVVTLVTSRENRDGFGEPEDGGVGDNRNALHTFCMPVED